MTGHRVALRALRKEDIPTFTRWFHNLEFSTYISCRGFYATAEDEIEWYDRNAKFTDTSCQFAIVERRSGRHIGNCGLFNISARHQSATLGIGIGETDACGRGHGTEAVSLLVQYGMFFRDLFSIRLFVFAFNQRAVRAYEKAGFRQAGRIRGAIRLGGERYDEIIMDITRDDVDLSAARKMVTAIGK